MIEVQDLGFMNNRCQLLAMHYTVFVKFNPSGKIEVNGNEITICLRSKPERGKANKEMIERLAGYFEVSKDKVSIISGLTSTKKLVNIIR
jgi:uncharacterized protein YggU (UPF0235/DUF167 family)